MAHPLRIQRKREKGWRMPEGAEYVGRPGLFGNPFNTAILYHEWIKYDRLPAYILSDEVRAADLIYLRKRILRRLPELRGKQLVCWCPLDAPCHADTLCELANGD